MNYMVALQVMYTLLARDMLVIKRRLKDDLLNVFCTMFFFNGVFSWLMPYLGARKTFSGESFLGTIVGIFIFIGFSRAFDDISDKEYDRLIDYRRTLPISFFSLSLVYILSYCIHMTCVATPALFIGWLVFIRQNIVSFNLIFFIPLYCLSMFVVATLFICLVFMVSFSWFRFNIWHRVLTPLHQLGCLFYSWNTVYTFNPFMASILLCNPLTYCSEGLRASLLPDGMYVYPLVSIGMLSLYGMIGLLVLNTIIRKRLMWV